MIELEKLRKGETIRQNAAAAATIQTQFRLHAKETKAAKSTSDKKGKKGKKKGSKKKGKKKDAQGKKKKKSKKK